MKKMIKWTIIVFASLFFGLWLLVYAITYHPDSIQNEDIACKNDVPVLKPGQKIKVLNWNVQYMGGKKNVFWYDLSKELREKGEIKTVNQPSREDVSGTLDEVARVILDEKPDIVLLQEVDTDSARTYNINQTEELLKRLTGQFACHADSYYWKTDFVPHPNVLGAVGMQVLTLSKYKIEKATRHQLALIPEFWLTQQFNIKRAILETRIPVEGGKPLVVMNTHLSAFSQGSNTMELQVKQVHDLVGNYEKSGYDWIIGGDFNLLPPGIKKETVHEASRYLYNDISEISLLFQDYNSVITREQLNSPQRAQYFTHLPNNPMVKKMDRTIDYIFYAKSMRLNRQYVRSADTLKISDHVPMVAEFKLSK